MALRLALGANKPKKKAGVRSVAALYESNMKEMEHEVAKKYQRQEEEMYWRHFKLISVLKVDVEKLES